MFNKKIWRTTFTLCTAFLLAFSHPLSVLASENTSAVAEENTEDTSKEQGERLEPDAYFEPIQSNEVEGWPQGPAVWAESAVVLDIDSGTFLYSKNMDTAKYPASITKIMTTLLAIENSRLDERVTFSNHAIYGIERNSSHIGIRPGEILSMEECIYGMMLASANEVCLAVAEHIGGSVDGFVEMMNQKATELGCTNTHFTNPNGLPDEQHYTTAHDMALIAQAAYKNEKFREVIQTKVSSIPTTNMCGEIRWFQNHHKMILDGEFFYDGCTGGKTGFTQAALNTLVTYAEKNGRRLVCVSLRTNGRQIYTDTAALLNYGFDNFQNITLYCRENNIASDMLYPSIFFRQPMTVDKMRSDCILTLPISVTQDQVNYTSYMTKGIITHDYQYNGYHVGEETVCANNFINCMRSGANLETISTELNGPIIDGNTIIPVTTTPEPATPQESVSTETTVITPESGTAQTPTPESIEAVDFLEETHTSNDFTTTDTTTKEDKQTFQESVSSTIETIINFDYQSLVKQIPVYIYGLIALLVVIIFLEIYFIFIYFKRRSKRRKTRLQRQKDRDNV